MSEHAPTPTGTRSSGARWPTSCSRSRGDPSSSYSSVSSTREVISVLERRSEIPSAAIRPPRLPTSRPPPTSRRARSSPIFIGGTPGSIRGSMLSGHGRPDLDHAVGAGDHERIRVLVALAQDRERRVTHVSVGSGPLQQGSASEAHRLVLLVGVEVGLPVTRR